MAQVAHFLWNDLPLQGMASALKTAPPHLGQFFSGSSDFMIEVSKIKIGSTDNKKFKSRTFEQ